MSVTTTENPVTTTLERTLQDYEVRVTGAADLPALQQQQGQQAGNGGGTSSSDGGVHWVPLRDHAPPGDDVANPAGWPTTADDRRGVPRYRPINRELDLSQRPWGGSAPETAFVTVMFTGVWIEAFARFQTASWLWRNTGGRFNDTYFRYKIGGEV
ncbi:hypothetical protein GGR56DRAFT_677527 [Xylariaceae sp. FL0804]|nr:hypothetical protein GGR56DRAFT_677527 [Xylariaceae sp. FL0804]